jgi:CRISPR-associated endonuclease/helicase Cas3
LTATSRAPGTLRDIRTDLFRACWKAAALDKGLFTLTAPTGAGKTLAMLAFALAHAERHDLRRVVVVLPYLSIIEQTALEYRKIFSASLGDGYVLEDHSLANRSGASGRPSSDSTDAARLLAENWDAPIVITTSVQCLESLFENRPAACRKLHRLANSVIMFDEVQTLPLKLAVPTLAALSRLTERYGASVVLSTATQPAFDHLDATVRKYCSVGWSPREIVPPNLNLFGRSHRVGVAWRHADPVSWQALAAELSAPENRRVLCIVNLKRHARELAARVQELVEPRALFHLSTNMCPAHRRTILEQVRARLRHPSRSCVLVATQCIEAGVDISFPRLYRAFAPLDSIAQAAGRCNREGEGPVAENVIVFTPEDNRYPPGAYEEAAAATKAFLKTIAAQDGSELSVLLDNPDVLNRYFRFLYSWRKADVIPNVFADAIRRCDFEEVARWYKLIPESTINVVVPYDQVCFARLVGEYEHRGRLTRDWVQQARDHTIGLFRPKSDQAVQAWTCLRPLAVRRDQPADETTADWFTLMETNRGQLYDKVFGFSGLTGQWIA